MKMSQGEAEKLARFIERVARPRTPDEVAECEHWLKRLQGPRS